MKKLMSILLSCVFALSCFTGCGGKKREKHSRVFFDVFDTVVSIISYQDNEEDFNDLVEYAKTRFTDLDHLYDIYNEYDGINNLCTVNKMRGKEPVTVDGEIIEMLKFAKERYKKTNGKVNIALGSVLKLWHDCRERYDIDPGSVSLPEKEKLERRAEHCDINNLIIDEEKNTVFLADSLMSLDVGAVAKGYATEKVAKELAEKYDNFAISAGGNVRTHGVPKDGRAAWSIGITNPRVDENYKRVGGNMAVAKFKTDESLVCSGGYQRYMVVGGKRYHHIIDPATLYPANTYDGVAIITKDSGVRDMLSTAIFLMEPKEALNFVNNLGDTRRVLTLSGGEDLYSDTAFDFIEH
jgi:thiamine biosynthesis lipoprotein